MAKAVAQVESYIDAVMSRRSDLMVQIASITGLSLKIVKPRGLIIAGTTVEFSADARMPDFFRLLNEGLKNIEIVPYDELSRRLRNTVTSIQRLATANGKAAGKRKASKKRKK